jgi:hypothetical protein
MSIIGSNILAGASGQAGGGGAYEISRSVRFNSSDSTSLSKNSRFCGQQEDVDLGGVGEKKQSTNSEAVFSAKTYATGIYINDTGGPGEIAIDFSTGTTSGTRTLRLHLCCV